MSILTLLRTVRILAQPALTTSEQYFKEAGVVWMGGNFESQFVGLEVAAAGEAELAVRELKQTSPDALIRAELGDKAEISVSQFIAFLALNCWSAEWFLFYLKGRDGGNLWPVYAHWHGADRDWRVKARSVVSTDRWLRGDLVVSR